MTEAVYQLYHPDPNTCPELALDDQGRKRTNLLNGEWVAGQYAKVVSWKQGCFLCPYCGSRVEVAAWNCFACHGRFLAPAGVRCPGHQLEGRMRLIPHHILKEVTDDHP